MKVKRNTLLLPACLVWSAAGVSILRIGLQAYPAWAQRFCWLGCSSAATMARRPLPQLLCRKIWNKKENEPCKQSWKPCLTLSI